MYLQNVFTNHIFNICEKHDSLLNNEICRKAKPNCTLAMIWLCVKRKSNVHKDRTVESRNSKNT